MTKNKVITNTALLLIFVLTFSRISGCTYHEYESDSAKKIEEMKEEIEHLKSQISHYDLMVIDYRSCLYGKSLLMMRDYEIVRKQKKGLMTSSIGEFAIKEGMRQANRGIEKKRAELEERTYHKIGDIKIIRDLWMPDGFMISSDKSFKDLVKMLEDLGVRDLPDPEFFAELKRRIK